MLYRRQKILLALLEEFGGTLKNTDLQKYLFLLSQFQQEKAYDFIPYKYGCFSFQAYHDKTKLIEKGCLAKVEDWQLAKARRYRELLDTQDAEALWLTKNKFGQLTGRDLICYVYENYPYYAIHSEIASEVLSPAQINRVRECRPRKDGTALCSIGYEGKSLEGYLNILIQENIKILCDVRKNPISRKYGFSKGTLSRALRQLNIEYCHIPDLGIDSTKRTRLSSQADYDTLFEEYERTVLKYNYASVSLLCRLLQEKQRIAVTCFEKSPQQCHRTRVVNAVLKAGKGAISLIEA